MSRRKVYLFCGFVYYGRIKEDYQIALINVVDLTFAYEGTYDNIFEGVNFQIDSDWKLGFIGRNGRGKTTFLNLLLGKYEYSGTITASGLSFEYFPYEVMDREEYTVDVIRGICPDAEDWQIMRELSQLQVEDEVLYRAYGTLSEGQRTKVLLRGLFLRETFLSGGRIKDFGTSMNLQSI